MQITSPERINRSDKVHHLETITKIVSEIVSEMDEETLECIAKVYEFVVKAGVHRAESIKVAEAAKVIENSQRDINVAFMNELSMIFHKMGIDTQAVLRAAGTKWNFLNFYLGLVGGHYLYRTEQTTDLAGGFVFCYCVMRCNEESNTALSRQ